MKHFLVIPLLGGLVACGGGGGGDSGVAGVALRSATETEAYLAQGFRGVAVTMVRMVGLIPMALQTGVPGPDDVTFGPGTEPNSVVFAFPFDADGDGLLEGTMQGNASGAENTTTPGVLYDAALDFVATLDDGTTVEGDFVLAVRLGRVDLYGVATFDDPVNGYAGTILVPAGDPLFGALPEAPTTGPWVPGNLCVVDLDGAPRFDVDGPDGTYVARWRFVPGATAVQTVARSMTLPGGGAPEALPDGRVPLPGCPEVTLEDFAGTWTLQTVCPGPTPVFITSRLEIAIQTSTTLSVAVHTPPESTDPVTFTATLSPQIDRLALGTPSGSDAGGDYATAFVLVAVPGADALVVGQRKVYDSGPLAGEEEVCGGIAGPAVPQED